MAIIAKANPARDLVSKALYMATRSRFSKTVMIESIKEYGEYLKCYECDINLIVDAIKETRRADLYSVLDEIYAWYWKMDVAAGNKI